MIRMEYFSCLQLLTVIHLIFLKIQVHRLFNLASKRLNTIPSGLFHVTRACGTADPFLHSTPVVWLMEAGLIRWQNVKVSSLLVF